jgi:hypothetical protein
MDEYDFYCYECGRPLEGEEHTYCKTCERKHQYKDLYEDVIKIDPRVRFSTICDMDGKIKYSRHAQGVENLLSPEENKKSLEQAVSMWKSRKYLEPKIGKGKYVVTAYEKVKRITMPLDDNHLLYVTTDASVDHDKIIERIMKLKERLT